LTLLCHPSKSLLPNTAYNIEIYILGESPGERGGHHQGCTHLTEAKKVVRESLPVSQLRMLELGRDLRGIWANLPFYRSEDQGTERASGL